jgi:ribosomal protein S18 acetylase RimI-like enzyme
MAVKVLRNGWVRAVDARDAHALLRLHRELWIDHDQRGGMPAARDEQTWQSYGHVLERQLSHRDGRRSPNGAFEGKLGHFVAEWDGRLVGQVEVYLDRFGFHARTPHVAELRSLIVTTDARGLGLGAALVREAAASSRARSGDVTLIAAEVLARNEALSFYDRLGFRTLERLVSMSAPPERDASIVVRTARSSDAGELAVLDHGSRARRHGWGDPRFDPPSGGVGADLVRLIADGIALDDAQRGVEPGRLREEILARDRDGRALAAAYIVASPLGAPFSPVVRAEVARLAADADDPASLAAARAVVAEAFQRARALGAKELLVRSPFLDPLGAHLADLPGARPFSWILAAPASTVVRRSTKP